MAIDATVSGTTANSYVTLAEANAFVGGRVNTDAWDDASDATKEKALRHACRVLNAQEFDGSRTTTTQALQWPRTGVIDRTTSGGGEWDWYTVGGSVVDSATIPQFVKDAQCEFAVWLLQNDDPDTTKLRREFESVGLGSLTVQTRALQGMALPMEVAALLHGTLRTGAGTRLQRAG